MYGTYETVDNRPALRFERRLPHPVERVWRAVTQPDELGHWFPTTVEGEPRAGTTLTFKFPQGGIDDMHGEVLDVDPPRRFVFTWGGDELRFELEPDGDSCVLHFTALLDESDKAARDGAGWHVCLDTLEAWMAGEATVHPGSRPKEDWIGHYEEYERRGLPTGAEIPAG